MKRDGGRKGTWEEGRRRRRGHRLLRGLLLLLAGRLFRRLLRCFLRRHQISTPFHVKRTVTSEISDSGIPSKSFARENPGKFHSRQTLFYRYRAKRRSLKPWPTGRWAISVLTRIARAPTQATAMTSRNDLRSCARSSAVHRVPLRCFINNGMNPCTLSTTCRRRVRSRSNGERKGIQTRSHVDRRMTG